MTAFRTTRRSLLLGLGASAALALWREEAFAYAPTDRRFVLIILRGGMDGLGAIPPYGDPNYAALRGTLGWGREELTGLELDPLFALHPSLTPLKRLYEQKHLLAIHAAATEYRSRSHFDAQGTLEAGALAGRRGNSGWVYRALKSKFGDVKLGLAVGAYAPLAVAGQPPVASYAPSNLRRADASFLAVVSDLWQADPVLGPAMATGLDEKEKAEEALAQGEVKKGASADIFPVLADSAGRLLAQDTGPRIAVLDMNGFDTHRSQGLATGPLARSLTRLAAGIEALERGLGKAWSQTVVVAVSEFGRTVRPNGTLGTDHGVGSATLLAGGAVAGGRVIADWPGLAERSLFEGRDLRPTTDLRAVFKGILTDHLQVSRKSLDEDVFPGSSDVKPMPGLIRA